MSSKMYKQTLGIRGTFVFSVAKGTKCLSAMEQYNDIVLYLETPTEVAEQQDLVMQVILLGKIYH